MFDLTGKTAVITGSSRGIGKAIAAALAQQGANVVISSRKAEACEAVAQEINALGRGRAVPIACNISHKEQLQALVDEARRQFGKIDVLVCNAAVNPYFGALSEMPDSALEKILHC